VRVNVPTGDAHKPLGGALSARYGYQRLSNVGLLISAYLEVATGSGRAGIVVGDKVFTLDKTDSGSFYRENSQTTGINGGRWAALLPSIEIVWFMNVGM